MGWAKFREDVIEAISDADYLAKAGNYVVKSMDPPVFSCAYCNHTFYNKIDLYNHIRNAHRVPLVVFVVNGKIVNDECYVKEITSLIVIRYDPSKSILIDKKQLNIYDNENEIDVTKQVREVLIRNKQSIIQVGDIQLCVKLIAQEQIDLNKIDAAVDRWNKYSSEGKHIPRDVEYKNEVERKCLDGIYNYFIACVSKHNNRNRYEDAYSILSEYIDIVPVAKTIIKIIALKFNWVEKLHSLCNEDDVFDVVCGFLMNSGVDCNLAQQGESVIFIEDELEDVINLIVDYQRGDVEVLQNVINRYPFRLVGQIDDINHRDKICLLVARALVRKNKPHEARRFYEEIQTPYFMKEVNEYIEFI